MQANWYPYLRRIAVQDMAKPTLSETRDSRLEMLAEVAWSELSERAGLQTSHWKHAGLAESL